MEESTKHASTSRLMGYWITTGLLVIVMIGSGTAQLIQTKGMADGFRHLGYPLYLTRILGTWKVLGGLVLLIPGYGLVKEWAYAGFFFLLSGAVMSLIASGDGFAQWIFPFTCALLTVGSWYLRPANRRIKPQPAPDEASLQP